MELSTYGVFAAALFVIFIFAPAAGAESQNSCVGDCAKCHSLTPTEAKTIIKGLGDVKNVKMSPVKGLWELTLERNGREGIAYLDFSKKYILPGPIFDLATGNRHGTPPSRNQARKTDVSKIPLSDSVILGNPNGKKKMFVFTDPDCPFCRKMHEELKRLTTMEPDLAIYVKMYPLNIHPKAYGKARVILGAGANAPKMLDKAFSGEPLPEPGPSDPAGPVDESIRFAESIGIYSTPTLVLPDGTIAPGVMDSETIRILLHKDDR
ncbi:MAG TPA: DsbC family protein [Geobacteraceae bacterium]|nr:DsbC family protein [Geobacteraceae bacterium]